MFLFFVRVFWWKLFNRTLIFTGYVEGIMYFMLHHYCKLASKNSYASPVLSNLPRWKDADQELLTVFVFFANRCWRNVSFCRSDLIHLFFVLLACVNNELFVRIRLKPVSLLFKLSLNFVCFCFS